MSESISFPYHFYASSSPMISSCLYICPTHPLWRTRRGWRGPNALARTNTTHQSWNRVQIILHGSTTSLSSITQTTHRTSSYTHQARGLGRRCGCSSVAFPTVFDTSIKECCCRRRRQSGLGRGDAEVWRHTVVDEKSRHIMSSVKT